MSSMLRIKSDDALDTFAGCGGAEIDSVPLARLREIGYLSWLSGGCQFIQQPGDMIRQLRTPEKEIVVNSAIIIAGYFSWDGYGQNLPREDVKALQRFCINMFMDGAYTLLHDLYEQLDFDEQQEAPTDRVICATTAAANEWLPELEKQFNNLL